MRYTLLCFGFVCACATHLGGDNGDAAPSGEDAAGDAPAFIGTDAASTTDSPPSVSAGIYANTFTELYRFDPATKTLTLVAPFAGCNDQLGTPTVWDIGIDALGNCYATTSVGLWKVDLQTAVCTKVAGGTVGSYPPSEALTFIPKGTVDPTDETLVGYVSGGANPPTTTDPYWNSTYASVAFKPYGVSYWGVVGWGDVFDVVSVANGGTFAIGHDSAYSADCKENCLLQIDPKSGAEIKHFGTIWPVDDAAINGLAYWAGVIYAFDGGGGVTEISWNGTTMVTQEIIVQPAHLYFMGAASTTAAPALTPDGGGPPIN